MQFVMLTLSIRKTQNARILRFYRVHTVRESQDEICIFGPGHGKSGNVREFFLLVREIEKKVREVFFVGESIFNFSEFLIFSIFLW